MLPSLGAANTAEGAMCSVISTARFAAHVEPLRQAGTMLCSSLSTFISWGLWPLVRTSYDDFAAADRLFKQFLS